jgi:hypothetical protein
MRLLCAHWNRRYVLSFNLLLYKLLTDLGSAFDIVSRSLQTVTFLSLVPGEINVDLDLLKSSIRVEHLGFYMSSPGPMSTALHEE